MGDKYGLILINKILKVFTVIVNQIITQRYKLQNLVASSELKPKEFPLLYSGHTAELVTSHFKILHKNLGFQFRLTACLSIGGGK